MGGFYIVKVYYACTLYAADCLRNSNTDFPWYPVVGIPVWGARTPLGQAGHPSRLNTGTLPAVNSSEYAFAMHVDGEQT